MLFLLISMGLAAGCPQTPIQALYAAPGPYPTAEPPQPSPSPTSKPTPIPLESALYTATFAGEDLVGGAILPIQASGSEGTVTLSLLVPSDLPHADGRRTLNVLLPNGQTLALGVDILFTDTLIEGTVHSTVRFTLDPESPDLKAGIGIVVNL